VRWRLIRGSADPSPVEPEPRADAPGRRPVRRDRRGRGLRGPLAPPESPLSRTRAEAFNDLVLDGVERLEVRWRKELAAVEFAVEAVPGPGALPTATSPGGVPLSRLHPGGAGRNARIVLYRRPIEARAKGRADLAILVQDLITEQVAELLGLEPDIVDPDYGLD
jgi:hypothetical protein